MDKILVKTNTNDIKETKVYDCVNDNNKIIYHESNCLVTIDLVNKRIIRKNEEYEINIDLIKEKIDINLIEYQKLFSETIKVKNMLFNNDKVYVKYKIVDENRMIEYEVIFIQK